MNPTHRLLGTAFLCSVLSTQVFAQNLKANTEHIKFGFLNTNKTQLLLLESLPPSKAGVYQSAQCSESGAFKTQYLIVQKKGAKDTARDNAYNFDARSGTLYNASPLAKASLLNLNRFDYCFALSNAFVNQHSILTPKLMGNIPLRAVTLKRIAIVKKRPIKSAWFLAQLDADTGVAVVRFARQGQSELLSLVLIQKDTLMFDDYPAKYDSVSTWRVDDGNEFEPQWLKIVFGYKLATGYGLGFAWAGAESQFLSLLEFSPTRKTQEIASGSFYVAPQ